MDASRLSLVTTGVLTNPDLPQIPIDSRMDAPTSGAPAYLSRLLVDRPMRLTFGDVEDPLLIVLINRAGAHIERLPTVTEEAKIEGSWVQVLLRHTAETPDPEERPDVWLGAQQLAPPRVLSGHTPSLQLWPGPLAHVHVRPAPGASVPITVLAVPR